MSVISILSTENPVFRGYLFYGSVLTLKMMAMSILTGRFRMKNKAFVNPEDAIYLKGELKQNEDVERVLRAHRNDLENIPIFIIAGFGYILTDPEEFTALHLFRIFTLARFVHTFVYAVVPIRQPARGLAWTTGFLITGYMAITTALNFY